MNRKIRPALLDFLRAIYFTSMIAGVALHIYRGITTGEWYNQSHLLVFMILVFAGYCTGLIGFSSEKSNGR